MTDVYSDRGPLAACLIINDYVLYILSVENLGGPWSSGPWGPGPNFLVVDPPLYKCTTVSSVNVRKYASKQWTFYALSFCCAEFSSFFMVSRMLV